LYPNQQQRQALALILEIHRQVYNAAIKERRDAWKRSSFSISYTDQANKLKPIRTFDPDVAWCKYRQSVAPARMGSSHPTKSREAACSSWRRISQNLENPLLNFSF
jgi:hypothetical protein